MHQKNFEIWKIQPPFLLKNINHDSLMYNPFQTLSKLIIQIVRPVGLLLEMKILPLCVHACMCMRKRRDKLENVKIATKNK